MKTLAGSKGVQARSQDKGGKRFLRQSLIQVRSVHAVQDLKEMPRSSWRGHIAERIGHLILIALIFFAPMQSKAEVLMSPSLDVISSGSLSLEPASNQMNHSDLSLEGKDIAEELRRPESQYEYSELQMKDRVLLSWKTFFRDQSMLRRRIDIYA